MAAINRLRLGYMLAIKALMSVSESLKKVLERYGYAEEDN
jgi:hypothetical protein